MYSEIVLRIFNPGVVTLFNLRVYGFCCRGQRRDVVHQHWHRGRYRLGPAPGPAARTPAVASLRSRDRD